jgi:ribonuclease HI
MKHVTIYADGACSGNPGPGGWGAILEYSGKRKELSGGEAQTTNNRMELTGVITALEALKEPCAVDLYSDSKYVVDALQKGWAASWRKKGWIKSDKKPALNPDLWERLLELTEKHMPSPSTGSRATRTTRTTTAATRWRWRKGTSFQNKAWLGPRERPRRKCAGARTEFISGPQEIKSKRAPVRACPHGKPRGQ